MSRSQKKGERGAALVTTAILLAAFLAMAVVAIDVGHIANVATEAQTAAEVAATAGATALLKALSDGDAPATAKAEALVDAQAVVNQNQASGHQLPHADVAVQVQAGRYNAATFAFTPDLEPYNAVRATVTATNIPNIVAGIWPGNSLSSVTKIATAGLRSIESVPVDLPLMIGDCYLPETIDCESPTRILVDIPNEQEDTGWTNWNPNVDHLKIVDFVTGFTGDVEYNRALANTDSADPDVDVISFWLPHEWCPNHYPLAGKANACGGGGGGGPSVVNVGDRFQMIDKTPDQSTFILADGIVNHGVDTFRIPLMTCGDDPTKEPAEITGFATIQIHLTADEIISGTWNKKEWDISFVCDAETPGPPGGVSSGTGFVALLD